MREITVKDEVWNRGKCRYGLGGVRVKVPGYKGEFYVRSADWERHDELILVLNASPPDLGPGRLELLTMAEFLAIPEPPGLVVVRMSDVKMRPRPSRIRCRFQGQELDPPRVDVSCPADRCFLRSFWKLVDSRPKEWNEFNSLRKAKLAGVPVLPED